MVFVCQIRTFHQKDVFVAAEDVKVVLGTAQEFKLIRKHFVWICAAACASNSECSAFNCKASPDAIML